MKTITDRCSMPNVPVEVAVCPKCYRALVIECIDEWETESGKVTDGGLHITCITEPEIGKDDWDEWWDWHFDNPYKDWLPIDKKVLDWFNANFRVAFGKE